MGNQVYNHRLDYPRNDLKVIFSAFYGRNEEHLTTEGENLCFDFCLARRGFSNRGLKRVETAGLITVTAFGARHE